ncbi:MAG: UDP-N-acetylmuramate dehydrogenase [Candidatus Marinimicrobia bacterium]|jgi:UDP-N-acetylmuramate dehydrogenase|nr:UDP-N-acetylmuramate dehydrogenase [Candidatus Neomarinimicrobiota bacterium]MBT4452943.1 UDP-N-acetylmuramate dehydrogenase [Candidatus Neomarinimicrobiota bacterium]MBT6942864.1 UDP-N-acetylmuramate dehydrogenase [Candidatus Neomarinimicrobiota bacterium]MCP4930819.1 UDP-N-acetylmuramate dehydrogenase [Candidatus Neomarinimicrobiota bacterium]MDP6200685.1 UDP-N-acetylmuramate dehydrogenase [Candidatus Neomarinimicrobiota bacterium]|tara:strand:+ start:621 stop:1529 length:909 start_codon:yes stop_codon:yes gene_type:complete
MEILNNMTQGTFLKNEVMAHHTSYGVGGPAKAYITPKNRIDLAEILKFAKKHHIPTYFVGSGSNLLVSDEGIDGLVITLGKSFNQLTIDGSTVFAESGVMLGKMVKECIHLNLSGVESLIGVPGTLGGALVMNAGAFGGEISNYLKQVTVMTMDGQEKQYKAEDISFSYRHSSFPSNEIVIQAEFELIKSNKKTIMENRAIASGNRKASQPLKFRSAGSVFKNPIEGAAGYYIDQAGLKGTQVGDAEISPIHANFFVNHGKAKAADIVKLIRLAREAVQNKFGIKLKLEVKTLGFKPGTFDV